MIKGRYSLNWKAQACGCWRLDWLSYEADREHLGLCQTYEDDGWFYTVMWWLKIWKNSSH